MALSPEVQEHIDRLSSRIDRLNSELTRFRDPTKTDIAFTRELHELGNTPACSVSVSATVPTATTTTLLINSVNFQSDEMADFTDDQITPPLTGIYHVSAYAQFDSNATGYRELEIHRGDATSPGGPLVIDSRPAVNGASTWITMSVVARLRHSTIPTEKAFFVRALHTAGVNLGVSGFFAAFKVGELSEIYEQ
jgi:hypothetical protein